MSWTEAETLLRYEMLAAVNQQRLDSVLSKSARVDAADKAAAPSKVVVVLAAPTVWLPDPAQVPLIVKLLAAPLAVNVR